MGRHITPAGADMLVRIAALEDVDRVAWLHQLREIRQLPETTRCPRVERSWGRSA